MLLKKMIALAACLPAAPLLAQAADPARADIQVPPTAYISAFADYQPMQEDRQTPEQVWRQANEEVARIGGHAGYLRDDTPSRQPPEGSSRPAQQPAHPPHQH